MPPTPGTPNQAPIAQPDIAAAATEVPDAYDEAVEQFADSLPAPDTAADDAALGAQLGAQMEAATADIHPKSRIDQLIIPQTSSPAEDTISHQEGMDLLVNTPKRRDIEGIDLDEATEVLSKPESQELLNKIRDAQADYIEAKAARDLFEKKQNDYIRLIEEFDKLLGAKHDDASQGEPVEATANPKPAGPEAGLISRFGTTPNTVSEVDEDVSGLRQVEPPTDTAPATGEA